MISVECTLVVEVTSRSDYDDGPLEVRVHIPAGALLGADGYVDVSWQGCMHVRLPYVHFCESADIDRYAGLLKRVLCAAIEVIGSRWEGPS